MSSSDSAYRTTLTNAVLSTSIHRHLDFSLVSQSPSYTLVTFTTQPQHLTPTSTLHGGINTLALDITCFLAAVPTLSEGQSAATIASSFQITSVVAGVGKVVEVHAKVVKRGKDVLFCEGSITSEGKIVAKGSVTKMVIPWVSKGGKASGDGVESKL